MYVQNIKKESDDMYSVLIVDDEYFIRDNIQSVIPWRKHGIGKISTAKDGCEALNHVNRYNPDILLTDIRMPNMDGIELIRIIREKHKNIYCIIISAYNDFEYAQKAINLGVKGFLLKPVNPRKMIEAVQKAVCELSSHDNGILYDNHGMAANNTSCGDIVDKAIKYITINIGKRILLHEMALDLNVNPSYLSLLFKNETGKTFTEFVTDIRINNAKLMLMKSTYRIKDIAIKLGYEDYTYFCKIFKKRCGASPLKYRMQNMD